MAHNMANDADKPDRNKFELQLDVLSRKWDLGLEPPKDYSPSKMKSKSQKCITMLSFCSHTGIYNECIDLFDVEARRLHHGSIKKSRAERGVIPDTNLQKSIHRTEQERASLIDLLYDILDSQIQGHPRSPKPTKQRAVSPKNNAIRPAFGHSTKPLGIEPKKRSTSMGKSFDDIPLVKKPRNQRLGNSTGASLSRSFEQITKSSTSFGLFQDSAVFVQSGSTNSFQATSIESKGGARLNHASEKDAFSVHQPDKHQSSDYQASSFEAYIAEVSEIEILSFTEAPGISSNDKQITKDICDIDFAEPSLVLSEADSKLQERLNRVFPYLSLSSRSAPVCVIYEITRVYLHVEVSMAHLSGNIPAFDNYNQLWAFLKDRKELKGRTFPEKSSAEVWKCACTYEQNFHSIVFAGSLHFSSTGLGFFKLKLDPLKLDFSHRLGRRFGHDRFFELCIPALTGRGFLPDELKSDNALEIIREWLINTPHPLLGRFWQPFFVKPKEKRKRHRDIIKDVEEVEPAFRVYLFATSGPGFETDESLIKHRDPLKGHPLMSIQQLLNRIRPTRKNEYQSYLKLFQRTSLAVSRNRATVTLSKNQVRFQEKDIRSDKDECMNDGAARISSALAAKVAQKIGLDFIPSVFQGRFGEAKGLWVVDYNDKAIDDWIEVFPSQQKWTRSNKIAGESDDISHRTFEVLEWSRPLKSAGLNTQFLPILMDRAKDENLMEESLSTLVRSGLNVEVEAMISAMQNPLSFREWVRKCNPNFDERLKSGAISFNGGMPIVREEN